MPSVSTAVVGLSLIAVAAGPAGTVEAPRPADGIRLEYRFEEGDAFRMKVEEASRLLAVKGDVRQEQSNQTTTETRYVVTEVSPEGVATLRYRIESAQMQLRFDDGKPIKFDSREAETPEKFQTVRKAIGKDRLELDVKPDGTLVEIRMLDKKVAANSQSKEDGKDPNASADVFPPLPEGPVKSGSEWTRIRSMRVNVGTGLNSRLTREVRILDRFHLEKVEKGIATISYKTAPLEAIDDPTIQLQVAPQKASGTIRFDVARGVMFERTKKVDNLTIGWQGQDSSLMTERTRTERLMPAEQAVSSRE